MREVLLLGIRCKMKPIRLIMQLELWKEEHKWWAVDKEGLLTIDLIREWERINRLIILLLRTILMERLLQLMKGLLQTIKSRCTSQ